MLKREQLNDDKYNVIHNNKTYCILFSVSCYSYWMKDMVRKQIQDAIYKFIHNIGGWYTEYVYAILYVK